MDLIELLKRSEGKTLEFKRELSAPDGVLCMIVTFTNTAGGTLLIGVEDRSGHVRGVVELLDPEERLVDLISDEVTPRLVPEIEILTWRRAQVLAVRVHLSRPHSLKRGSPGGVYVRAGCTNRRTDRELVEELRRLAGGQAIDEQPMPDLDSEAMDFRAASTRQDRYRTGRVVARLVRPEPANHRAGDAGRARGRACAGAGDRTQRGNRCGGRSAGPTLAPPSCG
ncbi:MAG TPA: RNA-binding domain-containing protein [bacterium]|nr:RNA-binding domain-containing protein [bacterium]